MMEDKNEKDITIQYVLNSTDGLLVPCRDKNGQEVYIPLSLLISTVQKELARSIRSKGFASVGQVKVDPTLPKGTIKAVNVGGTTAATITNIQQ